MNSFNLKSLQSISSTSCSDSSQFTTSPMSGGGSTAPGSETRRPGVPNRTDPGPGGPGPGLGEPGGPKPGLGDPGDEPQHQQLLLLLDGLPAPLPWPRPRPPPLEGGLLAAQRLGVAALDPVVPLTLPPQLLHTCNTNRKW